MAPEEELKQNRISLLQNISSTFLKIADFSLIVEEGNRNVVLTIGMDGAKEGLPA